MLKMVILGCNGQVGSYLTTFFNTHQYLVYPLSRQVLDVTNREQFREICKNIKPDIIVNCSAITDLNITENNATLAFNVNSLGAMNAAIVSEEVSCKLISLSTDYVFDGFRNTPYTEYDIPNPINVYGRSKEWGERLILSSCHDHLIVRTSWIYGGCAGNNFLTKLINKVSSGQTEVKVVTDEISNPTFLEDFSEAIKDLIKIDARGTFHVTGRGYVSRYDFAKMYFDMVGIEANIIPCFSEEYNNDIKRPHFSSLNISKVQQHIGREIPHWSQSFQKYVRLEQLGQI